MMDEVTCLRLDARSLGVEFIAWLGPFPVRGRFDDVRGTLVLAGTDIARTNLEVVVAAESLSTGLAARDRHLRGPSFLDARRHPFISFTSRRVQRDNGELRVAGTLLLRGRSCDVVSTCPVSRLDDADRSGRVSLCGRIDVPIRDYGIAIPRGIDRLNPIFLVVGRRVRVHVSLVVPATLLRPMLLPAPAR